jgi:hypothetical protein
MSGRIRYFALAVLLAICLSAGCAPKGTSGTGSFSERARNKTDMYGMPVENNSIWPRWRGQQN